MVESCEELEDFIEKHIDFVKIILAGGLYPKLAISDSSNAYRVANRGGTAGAGAEMVFHTRVGWIYFSKSLLSNIFFGFFILYKLL